MMCGSEVWLLTINVVDSSLNCFKCEETEFNSIWIHKLADSSSRTRTRTTLLLLLIRSNFKYLIAVPRKPLSKVNIIASFALHASSYRNITILLLEMSGVAPKSCS